MKQLRLFENVITLPTPVDEQFLMWVLDPDGGFHDPGYQELRDSMFHVLKLASGGLLENIPTAASADLRSTMSRLDYAELLEDNRRVYDAAYVRWRSEANSRNTQPIGDRPCL